MFKNKFLTFILFLIITFSASFIGGLATITFKEPWYSLLNKPTFNPPDWIFGPVWTFLYTLMGISAGIIWEKGLEREEVREALQIFGVHLLLNAFWTILFFGFQTPEIALAEILILLITIILYTRRFYRIDHISGWMQVPYIAWVSFATILNLSIVWLN